MSIDEIERAAKLLKAGYITKEEFEEIKRVSIGKHTQKNDYDESKIEPSISRLKQREDGLWQGPCPLCQVQSDPFAEVVISGDDLLKTAGSLVSSFFSFKRTAQSIAEFSSAVTAKQCRCLKCNTNLEVCGRCFAAVKWVPALTANCSYCGATLK